MSERKQKAVPIPERAEKPRERRQPLVAWISTEPTPRLVEVAKDAQGRPILAALYSWRDR
jgi:hypothetical protein